MRVGLISPRRQDMESDFSTLAVFTSEAIPTLPEPAAAERGRNRSGERS